MAKAPTPAKPELSTAVVPVPASTTTPDTTEPAASPGWSLDTSTTPFLVNNRRIMRLTIVPMSFMEFQRVLARAEVARGRAKGERTTKFFVREQIKAQVRAFDDRGAVIPLGDGDILNLPRAVGLKLRAGLNSVIGEPGTVISEGDGVTTPILFRFGQPLKLATGPASGGESQGVEIAEIEFLARTYGDVEDVVSTDNPMEQALALVQSCAKPVGIDIPLSRLPTWAVDQISVADGIAISEVVLPLFLQ